MAHKDNNAAWLSRVVDSANRIGIISFDPQGNIVTWNSGAERLFYHKEDKIRGQSGALIFTPEDVVSGEHEREMRIAAVEGHAIDDRWHLRRDGSRLWASGMMMAIRGEDGRVEGFVKVVQDKTDDKRLEEQLRASEEQFARVFLGNPAAIAVERRDTGALVLANERFFRVTGYWRSDLMGRPVADVGLWEDPRQRERAISGLEADQPCPSMRVNLVPKGCPPQPFLVTLSLTRLTDYPCVISTFVPWPEE